MCNCNRSASNSIQSPLLLVMEPRTILKSVSSVAEHGIDDPDGHAFIKNVR